MRRQKMTCRDGSEPDWHLSAAILLAAPETGASPSIANRRIGAAIHHVHLRIPEIDVRLVVLRGLLLLTLNLGQSLPFLISDPGGLVGGLATDQERRDRQERKKLMRFHISTIITLHPSLVTHHFL